MATAKETALIQEIQKKYGTHIDLNASPAVLLEIIRKFKHQLEDDDDDSTIAVGIDSGVGGGGGVSGGGGVDGGVGGDGGGGGGGVSTIAVGINSGRFQRVDNEALLREILTLKKQMKDMHDKIDGKAGGLKGR
jgi:hypothetical protein